MTELYTTEAPSKNVIHQVDDLVAKQRRMDTIQSIVVSVIVVALLGVILWLIAILPSFKDAETIVTYQAPVVEEENPVDRPDLAKAVRPKPSSASSAMARVIASAVESPIAVPVPEEANPTTPFGIDNDFNAGFGVGDGDGDGGGGSSFFGTPRKGKRVAYVVDFSESMLSDAEGGGTRLDALKTELVRSIKALNSRMLFNVVFFSHTAWTMSTDGPKRADNGWNGLNETPAVGWHPATDNIKSVMESEIGKMDTGLGTVWYSPLKMALSMVPPPDTIYMLSDGEPSDLEDVLNRIDEMNPTAVPIDTIALETPGSAARAMLELAQETGGRFTLIYKGKAISGMSAEKYTTDEYD